MRPCDLYPCLNLARLNLSLFKPVTHPPKRTDTYAYDFAPVRLEKEMYVFMTGKRWEEAPQFDLHIKYSAWPGDYVRVLKVRNCGTQTGRTTATAQSGILHAITSQDDFREEEEEV